jgi:UDP-GlcNAc:undecaprenyl-phosphate GlcNAc-1-phosphate transferase
MEAPSPSLYLVVFLTSGFGSFFLVPILRRVAFRFSIVDIPNQAHKMHQENIPYLGGMAIVIPVSILAALGPMLLVESSDYQIRLLIALAPSILLALVGLWDDINNLGAFSRFMVQSLVATIIVILLRELGFGVQIFDSWISDLFVSVLWLVGITNAFNFFDNLDGGASGIALIASLTLALFSFLDRQYLISLLALALAGASLGFLFWNGNPARIYLGDSGSLFIGFLLSVALLQYEPDVQNRYAAALIPVFILALPIIDTSVAVISRISRGVSIFQGGRDHLSHRLIFLGVNRKRTAFILWGLAVLFSSLTLVLKYVIGSLQLAVSGLILLLLLFLIIWFLTIRVKL